MISPLVTIAAGVVTLVGLALAYARIRGLSPGEPLDPGVRRRASAWLITGGALAILSLGLALRGL